jgi:hypothetical protein
LIIRVVLTVAATVVLPPVDAFKRIAVGWLRSLIVVMASLSLRGHVIAVTNPIALEASRLKSYASNRDRAGRAQAK